MKIYDESKIKPNDPLREQKIEALANIEELNKDLKRDSGVWYLQDKVIEKYIPIIIQEACGSEEDLIEKIINGQSEEEIKIIEVKINEALKRHGWELSWNLNDIYHSHLLTSIMVIDSYKRKEEGDKLLARLKNDLVKFDEAVPEIYHAYDDGDYYFVKTAINMMRDSLLVNIRDCEARIEKSQGDSEQQKKDKKASQEGEKVRDILCWLQTCEFSWSSQSSSVVVNGSVFMLNKTKHFGSTLTIETFREELEREINQVNDEWLPVGQKKADLLKKLETVIENGIREVKNQNASTANSSDTSDGYSEVSSETDNSSVGSADNHNDNKKPFDRNKPEFVKNNRKWFIDGINELLNQEPIVKEADLDEKDRNWLERIKAASSSDEIYDIGMETKIAIRMKRKIKQKNVDLDAILEETVDARNFTNHFQTVQRTLGESELQLKAERIKKKLLENDPELYFNHFNDWVKGEEEALELEAKNKVLAAELETISELEYNEEEQQFLAGQITDQQKKEEIAQRIEVKINVKKKTWSLIKWFKAQTKWIKTKAKLLKKNNKVGFEKKVKQIKQEIKNAENNSNLHVQQAFKHAKNKAEALLRDLESITSDNSNPAKNNNFPTSWVVGIGAALLTTILITVLIIKRSKNQKKLSR